MSKASVSEKLWCTCKYCRKKFQLGEAIGYSARKGQKGILYCAFCGKEIGKIYRKINA